MNKTLLLIILALMPNIAIASTQAISYYGNYPIQVCQPNDKNVSCMTLSSGPTILTANVGIGSSNPGQALDVNGTIRATAFIGTLNTAAQPNITSLGTISNLLTSGNVGIGSATPGTALDVVGTVRATSFSGSGSNLTGVITSLTPITLSGNNVGIGTTTPQGGFVVTNGNVGIGTWVPATPFQVNGSSQNFYVASNGNVGIGSTLPTGQLNIQSGTATVALNSNLGTGLSYFSNSDATSTTTLTVGQTLSSPYNFGQLAYRGTSYTPNGLLIAGMTQLQHSNGAGGLLINTNTNAPINFAVGGYSTSNEVMTLQNGGNVGIGTPTPRGLLDVNGTLHPLSPLIVDVSGNVGIGTTSTSNAGFSVMNGNVGIGTWIPGGALEIAGGEEILPYNQKLTWRISTGARDSTYIVNDTNNYLELVAANGSYFNSSLALGYTNFEGTSPYHDLAISGGVSIGTSFSDGKGLKIMNGNVGIGSTNPGQVLDVNGGIRSTTGNVYIGSSSVQDASALYYTSASGGAHYYKIGASYYETLNANGMSINNGSNLNSAGVGLVVGSGNVGIGSTSPGQALDVVGTVRASQAFYDPNQKATTGQRYVCIDINGQLVSSALACVGT